MPNKIFTIIKESIFPLFCLNCEKEGVWVCTDCLNKINTAGTFSCPVCQNSWLDFHLAITKYEETALIGKIIQTFKYQYAEEIINIIQQLITIFIQNNKDKFSQIDYIVPVPLHKKRECERGFNQAKLIGKIVADILAVPLIPALVRNRETRQQAKLTRQERIQNVKTAFILVPNFKVNNKNILLIDDVFTTGSTLQECAQTLKHANAKTIGSFTLARG